MKLIVLLGVIIAGMSSCGATPIAHSSAQLHPCAAVHHLAV
jgi:hypothetical protein